MRYSLNQRDYLQTGENLFPVQKSWKQRNLSAKHQKRYFEWDVGTLSVISWGQEETLIQWKNQCNLATKQQKRSHGRDKAQITQLVPERQKHQFKCKKSWKYRNNSKQVQKRSLVRESWNERSSAAKIQKEQR